MLIGARHAAAGAGLCFEWYFPGQNFSGSVVVRNIKTPDNNYWKTNSCPNHLTRPNSARLDLAPVSDPHTHCGQRGRLCRKEASPNLHASRACSWNPPSGWISRPSRPVKLLARSCTSSSGHTESNQAHEHWLGLDSPATQHPSPYARQGSRLAGPRAPTRYPPTLLVRVIRALSIEPRVEMCREASYACFLGLAV